MLLSNKSIFDLFRIAFYEFFVVTSRQAEQIIPITSSHADQSKSQSLFRILVTSADDGSCLLRSGHSESLSRNLAFPHHKIVPRGLKFTLIRYIVNFVPTGKRLAHTGLGALASCLFLMVTRLLTFFPRHLFGINLLKSLF